MFFLGHRALDVYRRVAVEAIRGYFKLPHHVGRENTGPCKMADDLSDKKSELSEYAAPEIKETDIDEKGDEATSDTTSDLEVVHDGADVSRLIVSLRDDGDTALTFRAAVIGTILTGLSAVVNQLYYFKPVAVSVSAVFLIIVGWLFGEFWYFALPTAAFVDRHPRWERFRGAINFVNPGPFRIKEHAVATIVATSASSGSAAIAIFAAQRLFYPEIDQNTAVAVLTAISASLTGYGLVGVFRPLCIYPSALVYWTQLPQLAIYQSFHHDPLQNKDRLRIFGWAFTGSALWEPIASYIFPTLSGVSVFCLASQKASSDVRAVFSNIFGGSNNNEGLGTLSLGFDWQYITSAYLSLPLIQQANSWLGLLLCYVVVTALYYTNTWDAKTFPFLSTSLFASDGSAYNQTAVFGSASLRLDTAALAVNGLPRLGASYVWNNLCATLAIGALLTHVPLFWGKDIMKAIRQSRDRTQPDPHYVGMLKYKEVPQWWYLITLAIGVIFGLVAILVGDTSLTWWGYFVAIILGAVIAPFSCFLYGVMGNGVATNNLSKMVCGAILPGRPVANLYFTTFSHEVIVLVVNLSGDLKLGQYLKIPWRTMFLTQIYGTILGAFVNYGIMISVVTNQYALLSGDGNNVWSGAASQSLNSDAVTWSLAKYVYAFGNGGYGIVPVGLVIGAVVPVIHWLVMRRYKTFLSLPLDQLCFPVVLTYANYVATGATSYTTSAIIVGLWSQWFVRSRKPQWFNKYMYLLGGALDGGSQVIIFILSFAVFGASGNPVPFPTWAGNPAGNVDYCGN